MKTILATAAIALSLTAPAFAQVDDVRAHFAAGETSPLESQLRKNSNKDTSIGNVVAARQHFVASLDSASERSRAKDPVQPTRNSALISFFAVNNDSPLEANRK